ncbi:Gfo/Idh/MocA family protein [Phycisphaerales bacterium AB-hyl4]|uniref:Gfo/Idh/MocA family protein n=1 Tax=Natronomicrosphaera hydrolytica TaxID=3242702 RepID=A0ABV4U167_9BACT
MASTKKLRIAFIGAGGIAGAHLRALAKLDDVEVVAMADVAEAGMKKHAEEYGIPSDRCYTDYQEMLDKVEPDAVSVCTPNGLHAPNSIAALKAGAHVFVEKPMAMNAEEARQMIDVAKSVDRKLVIGFQYRFAGKTQFLKRAADDGLFGKIMFGRVQALRRRGIPNWGVFGRKDLQGGGPMIDIGVHMLEMCHYTMGSPRPVAAVGMTDTYLGNKPSEVSSRWPGWDHKTYTVEDFACGHIRFENGEVIHIESMFAGHIEQDVMDFQLMGHKGGAVWSESRVFTDQNGHMVDIKPNYLESSDFPYMFDRKMRDFVDHVLYNKPSMAPAEHGLRVQQMLDGIYRSAEQGGKEVAIEELATVE